MSWLNKKKEYKALVEEKESTEQEQKQEQTYYLAASSYLTNPDYSEKKEESPLYQAQPNQEKLKKIL